MDKKFKFLNEAAKRAYKELPPEIQKQFGSDLNAIQQGKRPFSDFEDVSDSVGAGAIELKENGSPAYRAVYCAKYLDTVYILHAFTKTTNASDRQGMKTAELRHKDMMKEVRAFEKAEKMAKKKQK